MNTDGCDFGVAPRRLKGTKGGGQDNGIYGMECELAGARSRAAVLHCGLLTQAREGARSYRVLKSGLQDFRDGVLDCGGYAFRAVRLVFDNLLTLTSMGWGS